MAFVSAFLLFSGKPNGCIFKNGKMRRVFKVTFQFMDVSNPYPRQKMRIFFDNDTFINRWGMPHFELINALKPFKRKLHTVV